MEDNEASSESIASFSKPENMGSFLPESGCYELLAIIGNAQGHAPQPAAQIRGDSGMLWVSCAKDGKTSFLGGHGPLRKGLMRKPRNVSYIITRIFC